MYLQKLFHDGIIGEREFPDLEKHPFITSQAPKNYKLHNVYIAYKTESKLIDKLIGLWLVIVDSRMRYPSEAVLWGDRYKTVK